LNSTVFFSILQFLSDDDLESICMIGGFEYWPNDFEELCIETQNLAAALGYIANN
jgi:hypothetical protein